MFDIIFIIPGDVLSNKIFLWSYLSTSRYKVVPEFFISLSASSGDIWKTILPFILVTKSESVKPAAAAGVSSLTVRI